MLSSRTILPYSVSETVSGAPLKGRSYRSFVSSIFTYSRKRETKIYLLAEFSDTR
jgi:hypothetical protein